MAIFFCLWSLIRVFVDLTTQFWRVWQKPFRMITTNLNRDRHIFSIGTSVGRTRCNPCQGRGTDLLIDSDRFMSPQVIHSDLFRVFQQSTAYVREAHDEYGLLSMVVFKNDTCFRFKQNFRII